jgi:ABC-type lipoprotein export system ATPase subunit
VEIASLYREPEAQPDDFDWPALELHDVFKIYRSGPVESVALRGLELEVEKGEFVALLGPSGCGKSTLLNLAAGLDLPSAGEVRAFGQPLAMLDQTQLAEYRAKRVAIVFQSENLWPFLSARENVATALRLSGMGGVSSRADDALNAVGLGPRARHRVAELSGGEQQRVAIAAAAAREAPLVLADEPSGELDTANEQIVLQLLARLSSEDGTTVIVVTHSNQVAASADRVVELRDGQVAT